MFDGEEIEEAQEADEQTEPQAKLNQQPANSQNSKEAHEKQKTLKLERKAQKPHFEILSQAKKIWEKMRRKDVPKPEREKLISDLMALVKGRVVEVIFKHDASRVIQTCLKYGNPEHRNQIASELKGRYLELSKSMYGKFIVIKILHYCPKYREHVIKEFYGKVRKLIRHKEASEIIEEAFGQFANSAQRHALVEEFYGPEFALFKSADKKSLDDILKEKPEKKESILKHLNETISAILDKGTINHSIVHRAMYEYLTHTDANGVQEMIAIIKEQVAEILHTKDGAQVAMLCLLYATPKDRKVIVKSFKPFVQKICQEEYGHMVLLRLFDVVDDTVLVNKNIISEICNTLDEIVNDKYGRRVVLYLLAGRSPKYISPDNITLLQTGDEVRATTSKKEPAARSKELLNAISPALLKYVSENLGSMLREPFPSQVCFEVFRNAAGDKSALFDALKTLIAEDDEENHILENTIASRTLKTLIQSEYKSKSGEIKTDGEATIGPAILDAVQSQIAHFSTSGGSFVVLALLESPACQKKVMSALKKRVKDIKKAGAEGNKGAEILAQTITKLGAN
ncbi:ARM repeat-containing protein [Basidiobolus meristosporus CBS 931.73]|uniref:ARM repeat-containing protein n=1 Tax=Basidiobolus meristosporus CBS 931.73 TaxID=1314790 RepID=A0A1Y1VS80_9FUNG|nr:ARM repeat-containing protein [Basidiobolus meristosporus CBS 931.73]ORX90434.1 ARM repeat-containing protein [Basidiobolus meristosporus CBS 931.73]|eukprot:ORX64151.1 ARM repeat-containing protein [Basidiobolus meristosporus CBS 931.73]